MMLWLIVSTALWCYVVYLAYKSGHEKGFHLAQSREQYRRALDKANARLVGRLDAWREFEEMIMTDSEPHERTH